MARTTTSSRTRGTRSGRSDGGGPPGGTTQTDAERELLNRRAKEKATAELKIRLREAVRRSLGSMSLHTFGRVTVLEDEERGFLHVSIQGSIAIADVLKLPMPAKHDFEAKHIDDGTCYACDQKREAAVHYA